MWILPNLRWTLRPEHSPCVPKCRTNKVLLPGQFTKVKLLLDVREGAVAVPQKAVTIEKGGAYIFVMRRDSTVEKRFIELGPEFGNNWVVERGLVAGEQIVTEGFHKLTPGMKVRARLPFLKGGRAERVIL